MPVDLRKTRVVELIEDGRFDDMLEPMGKAILRRLRVRKDREERLAKNKARREKAARKRGTA